MLKKADGSVVERLKADSLGEEGGDLRMMGGKHWWNSGQCLPYIWLAQFTKARLQAVRTKLKRLFAME